MNTPLEKHMSLLLEDRNLKPEARKLIERALVAQQTAEIPKLVNSGAKIEGSEMYSNDIL